MLKMFALTLPFCALFGEDDVLSHADCPIFRTALSSTFLCV